MNHESTHSSRGSIVSLVGMSGAGKTHIARSLSNRGFTHYCVDDIIAAQLGDRLNRQFESLQDVAAWLGFPNSPQYAEHARTYQMLEAEAIENVLLDIDSSGESLRIIVDTTGSMIHLPRDLLVRLQTATTIVHLATPPSVRQRMLDAFRVHPTPLIWDSYFRSEPGESTDDAFLRSYAGLVERREVEYDRWGALTLDYDTRWNPEFDPVQFFRTNGIEV